MFYQLTPVAQMQSGWRMSSVCKLHEYVFAVGDIKMFHFFLIHFVFILDYKGENGLSQSCFKNFSRISQLQAIIHRLNMYFWCVEDKLERDKLLLKCYKLIIWC